jgi:multidrug efflux system membrane fusion protein
MYARKTEKTRRGVPVTVATAEQKDVPIQIRAIGSVQPMSTVAVRALASGQLLKRLVPRRRRRPARAAALHHRPASVRGRAAQAQANLARDEAQLRNAEVQAKRYAELVKKDYVTKEEYDKIVAGAEAARAVVAADRAAHRDARLQLSYCEIRSPIDGRTGSLQVHTGNLVKANDTTPLVVINQISRCTCSSPSPRRSSALRAARFAASVPVAARPQGGARPSGALTFVDNAVDPTTGTITLKATFANRDRALWPGSS